MKTTKFKNGLLFPNWVQQEKLNTFYFIFIYAILSKVSKNFRIETFCQIAREILDEFSWNITNVKNIFFFSSFLVTIHKDIRDLQEIE